MKKPPFRLRFRTRLALVMFLTMGCTSAIMTWTHFQHRGQIMDYIAQEAQSLFSISQLTQAKIPANADLNQASKIYQEDMEKAGFRVTVATPDGKVITSTIKGQVGKTIRIKKRKPASPSGRINIKATLPEIDVESSIEQKIYTVQFPIIQNDKVLGYAQVQLRADEVQELLRLWYKERLYSLLATLMVALAVVVYLAFRFTKPIDLLVESAQQVAQGHLNVALPVRGSDEMARLAESFNRMVEKLRENRALQERLHEAEKSSLLGRFAATIAHEVRNSLNFINLSIDQVRAKYRSGDERTARELQRNFANIKDEINRLNRLVSDFMAAGRQVPPRLAPCDLTQTATQAIAVVEKQAERQGIKIEVELPNDLPTLMADAVQMKTCFLNILTNALEAMPEGGQIHVSGRHLAHNGHQGAVRISFTDTGPGIPAEDRGKVFDPYFSTKATGLGLGLAITRKIVEDHGGRIYVADGERPGTEMVVELPLAGQLAPSPAVVPASPSP